MDKAVHLLCTEVLTRAVAQFKCRKGLRRDAGFYQLVDFFMSDTFELYCDAAHVNPEWLLEKLGIEWRYVTEKVRL